MKRYAVKIVPKASPNADGEWINVECQPLDDVRSWIETARIVEATGKIPSGYFVAAVRSNN